MQNEYEQRTIPPIAEIIGEHDPRAALQVEATDADENVLPANVEQAATNFRVTVPVDNDRGGVTTAIEVEATLDGSRSKRAKSVTTKLVPQPQDVPLELQNI